MRRRAVTSLVLLAFVAGLLARSADAADSRGKADADAGLLRIERIEVRGSAVGPVVLLRAQGKAIPIFVDLIVAASIQAALAGDKLPRPLTHDLMHSILEGFDGKVSRVVITLKGATYYADLTVLLRGTTKVFDSRSSDAIALAIHFGAPVLVSKELLDRAGTAIDEPQQGKPGEVRL
jgi:bifunctional DNase/RNase